MSNRNNRIKAERGKLLPDIFFNGKRIMLRVGKQQKETKRLTIVGEGHFLKVDQYGIIQENSQNVFFENSRKYAYLKGDVLEFYFSCEGKKKEILQASKELAQEINTAFSNYDIITLLGFGKCVDCFLKTAEQLNRAVRIATVPDVSYYDVLPSRIETFEKLSYREKHTYFKARKQMNYAKLKKHVWINFDNNIHKTKEIRKIEKRLKRINKKIKRKTRRNVEVFSDNITGHYVINVRYKISVQRVFEHFENSVVE